MSPQGVLFDLDGTLVHSSPDIAHHLNTALARLQPGMTALAVNDVEMLIGGGMQELIIRGMNVIGVDPDPEKVDETFAYFRQVYEQEPVVKTQLYEGVEETLDALKAAGYGLSLCTNKREKTARLVLDHFGLDRYFDAVIGGDTTPKRKPDPDPVIAAARQIGLDPAATVMVGDSKADFGAARAAGARIMLVDWGYTDRDVRQFGADSVISSYAEFLPHLETMITA
ncbi:MAG: phosphoglycolate phosphatase [Candidatus Puniceispirillales bacterium]